MPIEEIFKHPMVKQVIFQITFPNLFFLESKIGDFQLKVMKMFPQSALLFRRQIVFADVGTNIKIEDVVDKNQSDQGQTKIWRFDSTNDNIGCTLNISSSSLIITSQLHKTYNHRDSTDKFRDVIKFVVDNFLEITRIPCISRIGLRYINECPMPISTKEFESHYNTNFPVARFAIENALEMNFNIIVKRDKYFLHLAEAIKNVDGANKLILDFDGFSNEVSADQYLMTADDLHNLILHEFENMIKDPIYKYMRGE